MADDRQTQSPTLPAFDFHNRFAYTNSHNNGSSQEPDASNSSQPADASFTFEFSDFGAMGRDQSGGLGAFLDRPAGTGLTTGDGEQGRQQGSKPTEETQSTSPVAAAVALAADGQASTPVGANTSMADTQKSERASPETWAQSSKDSSLHAQIAPPLDLGLDFLGPPRAKEQSSRDASPSTRQSENISTPRDLSSSASMDSPTPGDDAPSHNGQIRPSPLSERPAGPQPSTAEAGQLQPQDPPREASSLSSMDDPTATSPSRQQTVPPSAEIEGPSVEGAASLAKQRMPAVYPGSQSPLTHQRYPMQAQEEKAAPEPASVQNDEQGIVHLQAPLPSSEPQVKHPPVAEDGQFDDHVAHEGHSSNPEDQGQLKLQQGSDHIVREESPLQPPRELPESLKPNAAHDGPQQQSSRRTPSPQPASQQPLPLQHEQSQPSMSALPPRPHRGLPEPPGRPPPPALAVEVQSDSRSANAQESQPPTISSSTTTDFENIFRGTTFDDSSQVSNLAAGPEDSLSAGPRQNPLLTNAEGSTGTLVTERITDSGKATHSGAQTASTSAHSIHSSSGALPSTNSSSSINFSRPSGRRSSPPVSTDSPTGLPAQLKSLDLNSPPASIGSTGGMPPLRNVMAHQPVIHGPKMPHDLFPPPDSEHQVQKGLAPLPWQSGMQTVGGGGQQRGADELRDPRRGEGFSGQLSGQHTSTPLDFDDQLGMSREDSHATIDDVLDDNASDFFPNNPEPTDDNDAFFQGGNEDSGSSAEQQMGLAGESQAARLAAAYQRNEGLRSDAASTASAQNRSTLAGGTGNSYIAQSSSYKDSLMAGRPSTLAASPSGPLLDHSHLKPGQQAALLSHIKTLELYRVNAKKTNDPDLIYEFAVFMIDASKSMPDNPSGPPQPGSKEELIKEAIGLLKKIAERGQSDAQYFLADCYANGIGTPKGKQDFDRAYPLFVLASKHGHPDAAYRAGTCYEKGWGCRRDSGKALQFYRKAAAQSHPGAMYRLATAELNGELGLKRSAKEGVKWLKRSADNATPEFPHALHELALLHERGIDNILFLDPEYACELLAQAGEMGYAPSAYKLGSNYEYGRMGCPQDAGLSIHMYNIAAQQNHKEACFALTAWYLVGAPGILPQSDTEAYLWAKKAAEQGLAKAEYAVGYFTEMGIGTVKDLKEAKAWFTRAAEHGDHRANQRLVNLGAPTVKMPKGVGGSDHGKASHKAGQHGSVDVTDYASLPNSRRTQPTNAPFPSRIESSGMSPAGGAATTFPSPNTMRDVQSLQRETKYLANVAAHQQAQARASAAATRSATPPTAPVAPRMETSFPLAKGNNPYGSAANQGPPFPSFAQQANNIAAQQQHQRQPLSQLPPSANGHLSQSDNKPLPTPKPTRVDGLPTLPSIRASGIQQYMNFAPYSGNVAQATSGGNGAASPMPSAMPAVYPSYAGQGPNNTPAPAQARGTPPPTADSSNGHPFQISAQRNGPSSTPPPPPSQMGGPPQQPHLQMLRQSETQRSPQRQSGTPPPPSPQRSTGSDGVLQQRLSPQPSPAPSSRPQAGTPGLRMPSLPQMRQSPNGHAVHQDIPALSSSQQAQNQPSRQGSPAIARQQSDSTAVPASALGTAPQLTPLSLPQRSSPDQLSKERPQASAALSEQPQSGPPGSGQSHPSVQRPQDSPASPSAPQATSGEGEPRQGHLQAVQGNSPGPQQQRMTPSPGIAGRPDPPPQPQLQALQQLPSGVRPPHSDQRMSMGRPMVQQQQQRPPGPQGPPGQGPQSPQGRPGGQVPFGMHQQQRPLNLSQQGGPMMQYRPPPFHQQQGAFPPGQQRPPPPIGQQQQGPFPPHRFGPQSPPPGSNGPQGAAQGQGQRPPPMSPPPGWQTRPQTGPLLHHQHPPRQHDWIPSSTNRSGENHLGQHPQLPFSSYQGDTGLMTQGMLGLDSDDQATAQIAQRAKILEQRRLAASSQQTTGGSGSAADGDAGKKKKKNWFK